MAAPKNKTLPSNMAMRVRCAAASVAPGGSCSSFDEMAAQLDEMAQQLDMPPPPDGDQRS